MIDARDCRVFSLFSTLAFDFDDFRLLWSTFETRSLLFSRRYIPFQLSFLLDSSLRCALRAFTRHVADDVVVVVGSKQMDDEREQQQPLIFFLFRNTISTALLHFSLFRRAAYFRDAACDEMCSSITHIKCSMYSSSNQDTGYTPATYL